MVGFESTETPTFCFDRDELSMTEFNVDAFVVKYKREFGLEKLRDDLDLFLRVLKSSMVELINRDFADFLNLSTNLVGFDKSITTLKTPLNAMKTDIMKINENLINQRKQIEDKLNEQKSIRQRRQVIQSIIDIQKSIQQLNELDDAINLSKIDLNEMIERAVVQFSFISLQIQKCGDDEPAIEPLKSTIENLHRVFENRLTTAFIQAYREPNMPLLADSLKGLASISLQTITEQTFAKEIVRPFMENSIRNLLLQSSDISPAFEKTLDFIRTECKAMLYVVERINRECGSHFDFIVNSIFPELTHCLETSSQMIFYAGDPDVFHQRYSAWLKFIDELENLTTKSLKTSTTYQEFSARWDLVVYYQIRFQDISTSIETVLLNQSFEFNQQADSIFKTLIISTVFQSIERCWQQDIYLETLIHRFWKLTLQCLIRIRIWIESLNLKTIDIQFLVNLYVDLERLANEIRRFFQNTILKQRIITEPIGQDLSKILEQTLIDVNEFSRKNIKQAIISQLIDRCNETLHSIQDIPRMYRKTNRDPPSKPSNCIPTIFRYLQNFLNDYRGKILSENECQEFLNLILDELTKNYYEICSDILSTVKKMEDSMQRLRRVRESSKALSTMTTNTSGKDELTDDNKIRMQIQKDVDAFTSELENLGIDIPSADKLVALKQESQLQN